MNEKNSRNPNKLSMQGNVSMRKFKLVCMKSERGLKWCPITTGGAERDKKWKA